MPCSFSGAVERVSSLPKEGERFRLLLIDLLLHYFCVQLSVAAAWRIKQSGALLNMYFIGVIELWNARGFVPLVQRAVHSCKCKVCSSTIQQKQRLNSESLEVSALSAVHCPPQNSFRRVAYFANQKQHSTYPAVMQFEIKHSFGTTATDVAEIIFFEKDICSPLWFCSPFF